MPHFSPSGSGRDMVICQLCATMIDTTYEEPEWMEPVPGKTFNGNVCRRCIGTQPASREEQRGSYIDVGPNDWDDRDNPDY